MADVALDVEIRSDKGKGAARKLRAAGKIPGVCYGRGQAPQSVSLDPRSLERLIASSATGINTLIDLRVTGGGDYHGRVVLVKDLQRDPVSARALHADFFAVDLEQAIEVSVPIHMTGAAPGVTNGGILDHALRELQIECLPRAIPDQILVDVSQLEIGMSLHVRDLVLPEGVKLISDPDLSVVSVVVPAALEEETAAAAAPAEGEAVPAEGEAAAEAAEGAEAKEGEGKPEKGAKPGAEKAGKAEKAGEGREGGSQRAGEARRRPRQPRPPLREDASQRGLSRSPSASPRVTRSRSIPTASARASDAAGSPARPASRSTSACSSRRAS